MPADADKMHIFNRYLAEWRSSAEKPFWSCDGAPQLDYRLLTELLRIPVVRGDSARTGVFANALDLWIACELEKAGFREERVWPRAEEPRAADPNLIRAIEAAEGLTDRQIACELRAGGAQTNANVMGAVYTKQVDVGMSNWLTGPEMLISTKTMSGSFGKNLANRFEEAYGDVKNLRERYPLCAHGFFFLAHESIVDEPATFEKAIHMLRQLSRDGDVYDAVALLLVNWDSATSVDASLGEDKWSDETPVSISYKSQGGVPKELSCEHFFQVLIDIVLANSPIDAHLEVRSMRTGKQVSGSA